MTTDCITNSVTPTAIPTTPNEDCSSPILDGWCNVDTQKYSVVAKPSICPILIKTRWYNFTRSTFTRNYDIKEMVGHSFLWFFVRRYYWFFKITCCFILPVLVPVFCWNENWMESIGISGVLRFVIFTNMTFSINSFAHFWGTKPYDQ